MNKISLAMLALGFLALSNVPLVDEADAIPDPFVQCIREPCGPQAPPCIIGSNSNCKILITCVMEPCYPEHFP